MFAVLTDRGPRQLSVVISTRDIFGPLPIKRIVGAVVLPDRRMAFGDGARTRHPKPLDCVRVGGRMNQPVAGPGGAGSTSANLRRSTMSRLHSLLVDGSDPVLLLDVGASITSGISGVAVVRRTRPRRPPARSPRSGARKIRKLGGVVVYAARARGAAPRD